MAYRRGDPLINPSPLFLAASRVLSWVVAALGWPLAKVLYGFRLEGRENLKALGKSPAVMVSNHSIPLDSLIHGLCILPRLAYFSVIELTILTPFLGTLIRLLGGFPVSPDLARTGALDRAMAKALKGRGTVYYYSEGDCFIFNQEIKPFKIGAFYCAIENQAPLLPIVTVLRKRNIRNGAPAPARRGKTGLGSIRAEVHILPAIQPPPRLGQKTADLHSAAIFARQVRDRMQGLIDDSGGDKSLYRGPMPRLKGINDRQR